MCTQFCPRHLENLNLRKWRSYKTTIFQHVYVFKYSEESTSNKKKSETGSETVPTHNQATCANTLTCTFPIMPWGEAAYDSRQKSWLCCSSMSCAPCYPSARLHPSIPEVTQLSSCSRLLDWQLYLGVRTQRLDDECRVRRFVLDTAVSLVKKQHAAAIQSEKWGGLPSELCAQGIQPGWVLMLKRQHTELSSAQKVMVIYIYIRFSPLLVNPIHLSLKAKPSCGLWFWSQSQMIWQPPVFQSK